MILRKTPLKVYSNLNDNDNNNINNNYSSNIYERFLLEPKVL